MSMISVPTVLLVGAGQLGSRYLQGLASVRSPLKIFVVDPSPKSLDQSRERLNIVEHKLSHDVYFSTTLSEAPEQLNLAIIATPSHCRSDLVESISCNCDVESWLLEKLLAQNTRQVDLIENMLSDNSQAWVNIPRRLMAWHKVIKDQIQSSGYSVMQVRLTGGQWGLACNAIHFIDLVSWWTGSPVLNIDWQGLGDWRPSKRPGFMEVFGQLIINYQNGSSLELCCDYGNSNLQIETVTSEGIWKIIEAEGIAISPSGHKFFGELTYQSALTAPLVNHILAYGRCDLPSLVDSASQHRPFLDALLQHWNERQGVQDLIVSIT